MNIVCIMLLAHSPVNSNNKKLGMEPGDVGNLKIISSIIEIWMESDRLYLILQPQQLKGAKLSSSLEVVAISEVQLIMRHLQRAVVLASRGRHWTLLQNAARALWNTINSLVQVSEIPIVRKSSVLI